MWEVISPKNITKQLNNYVFTDYYYRLMLIAKSLFKWENLPNGIDEKWIERYLYNEGSCVFYEDPLVGLMVARYGDNGPLNFYNEPTLITPIAPNYIYTGKQLINNENCVIIRNNDDCIPTCPTVRLYALKLTNIDRTIDVNINQQKIPLVVKVSEKQKLSLKNVINQRNENEPIIWGDKNLDTSGVNVLNTSVPIVFDKLQVQKNDVWNECMTFLGINNANTDKKERLITDEVLANDEQIDISADVFLKSRQRAVDLINEMFGLDIKVTRRNDYDPFGMALVPTEDEEVREDQYSGSSAEEHGG